MKRTIKKTGMILGIVLLIGQLSSCEKREVEKEIFEKTQHGNRNRGESWGDEQRPSYFWGDDPRPPNTWGDDQRPP